MALVIYSLFCFLLVGEEQSVCLAVLLQERLSKPSIFHVSIVCNG